MSPRKSLHFKIIFFFLATALLPFLALAFISLKETKEHVFAVIKQDAFNLIDELGVAVEDKILDALKHVQLLAESSIIRSDDISLKEKTREMRKINELFKVFDNIVLLDKDGTVLTALDYDFRGDWSHKSWFKNALEGRLAVSPVHVIARPARFILVVTAPVLGQDGDVKAVLAGRIGMERIWEIADRVKIGKTGYVFLADTRGKALSLPDKGKILLQMSPEPFYKELLKNNSGVVEFIDEQNTAKISFFLTLECKEEHAGEHWRIGIIQDKQEVYSFANKMTAFIAVIAGACIAVIFFLAFVLSKKIVRPIRSLAKASSDVARGNFQARVAAGSEDELGELATSFNKMVDDLQKTTVSRDELIKEVAERKQAEAALRESEEKFRGIFDFANDGILIADIQTREFVLGNEKICQMLGYNLKELLALGVKDIHPPKDLPSVIGQFEKQMRKEIVIGAATPVLRKDGSIFYADISATPVEFGGKSYLIGIFRDITERKRADEELARLKQQIEFILGVTNTGLDIIDADFNMVYVDPEWKKVYGEYAGRKCYEYFMGNKEICPACGIKMALETRRVVVTEEVLPRERNRPIQVTTIPFQDASGKWLVAEVNVDISERKRQEEKLVQLNRLYSVLSNVNQAIVRIRSREELFKEVCRIAVEIGQFRMVWVGLIDSKDSMVKPVAWAGVEDGYLKEIQISISGEAPEGKGPTGTAVREGKHSLSNDIEHDERMSPWRNEALKRGYLSSAAFPFKLGEQVVGAINFYSAASHFFDEKEIGLLEELAIDISFALQYLQQEEQRKIAQESLQQKEEHFRSLIDNSTDLILLLDATGNIFYGSPSVERVLGYAPQEFLGRNMLEFIHSDDAKDVAQVLSSAVQTPGTVVSVICRIKHKDGAWRHLESIGRNMLEEPSVRAVVINSRDITERTIKEQELERAYRELKSAQSQLIQSAKMAAVGQLASGVAHEINNPLTGVLNNVQLIKMEAEQRKKFAMQDFKDLLNVVEESALRCRRITQSLLDFSRSSAGLFQAVSLNKLVEQVFNLTEHELHLDNIAIHRELQTDLPDILGDTQLLQQVIFNLVTNAKWAIQKKFGKVGGVIKISTMFEPKDKLVFLQVCDTGIGIAQENLQRIFEPFFTTKQVGEGTGVGLSLVYKIIKEHKGDIAVESEVDKGTTFRISFPAL